MSESQANPAQSLLEHPLHGNDYRRYAELNPAWAPDSLDPRAQAELEKLFAEETERAVAKEIAVFMAGVRAKIDQMQGNTTWRDKGGSTDEQFRAAPRTLGKTTQEAFVHPTERMVFSRQDAIDDQIIDPALLSNKALENLGLAHFIPAKRTKREDQITQRAAAIPAIHTAFSSLEPIVRPNESRSNAGDLRYFRLMRIGANSARGHLLGTQNVEGGRKIIFKTDIHGADVRLSKIESGHQDEIRKLKSIEITLSRVHHRLGDWQNLKLSPEDLGELQAAMLDLADSLQFVEDKSKRALRDKIMQAMSFKDSLDKLNPGATRTTILAALKHLGNRLQRIERIWGYLGEDKMKVAQLLAADHQPMEHFVRTVESMHTEFAILNEDAPLTEARKARIVTNLRSHKNSLLSVKFEPYLSFAEKCSEQVDRAIAALEGDKPPEAKKEFIKLYLITKMERAYRGIMDVRKRISLDPENIDPQALLRELEAMHVELKSHLVAPETEIPDYYHAYGELYHLFNSLKMRLRKLEPEEDTKSIIKEGGRKIFAVIKAKIAAKSPRLASFLNTLSSELENFMQQKMGDTYQEPSVGSDQKMEKLNAMKLRIKEFDFAGLVHPLV